MGTELTVTDKPELRLYDNPTPGQLLQLALAKESGIDVIERLTAVMERERDYQSRVGFDEALNRCQSKIARIAPDKQREHGIWWATYPALDRVVRPLYASDGFSLAFSQSDAPEGKIRVTATLSRGSISKEYWREVPVKKGGNATDDDAAAYSRGQRYLLLSIFNIAVGIDADEQKPYENTQTELLNEGYVLDMLSKMEEATTPAELQKAYTPAIKAANEAGDRKAAEEFDAKKRHVWRTKGFRAS